MQQQRFEWLEEKKQGTKFAPMYEFHIDGQSSVIIRLRLSKHHLQQPFGEFDTVFENRILEAEEFYSEISETEDKELLNIQRQAFAGMLWNKQFYHIDIPSWLNGDPATPATGAKKIWP